MKIYIKLLITFLTAILLISCGGLTSDEATYKNGTLVLTLNSDSRAITPDLDMTITTYLIEGQGPYSNTFSIEQDSTSPVFIQDDLREGNWTITVSGKNVEGTVVGQGSAVVEISQLSSTEATVSIEPIIGTGTIEVNISWPVEETVSPVVSGYLVAQEDIEAFLNPEQEADRKDFTFTSLLDLSVTALDDTINNGYYLLVLMLEDEDKTIWITNDIVRIVADETTSITISLLTSDINQLEGNLNLNITENMMEPLEVSVYLREVSLTIEEPRLYSAYFYVNGTVGDYTWLLDGLEVDVLFDEGNGLYYIGNLDEYRVYEMTIIETAGAQTGSKTISFVAEYNYWR